MKILSFLCLFIIWSESAQARSAELVYKNNRAVSKVQNERALEGYQEFLTLLGTAPHDLSLQYNLGASLGVLNEADKAEALFKQLLLSIDKELKKKPDNDEMAGLLMLRFASLYNLGVNAQAKKDIDGALDYYQKALEINPESKEIKTNIEMLLSSGGGGKGKDQDKDSKDKDKQQGDQGQDDKDKKDQQDKDKKDQQKQQKPQKQEFDQKQMSMEDLKRIMEELKEQEQGIRAKVQGKGGDSGDKDKDW